MTIAVGVYCGVEQLCAVMSVLKATPISPKALPTAFHEGIGMDGVNVGARLPSNDSLGIVDRIACGSRL